MVSLGKSVIQTHRYRQFFNCSVFRYSGVFCLLSAADLRTSRRRLSFDSVSIQLRFSFEKIELGIENNTLLEEWQEATGT